MKNSCNDALPYSLGDITETDTHWFTLTNRCNLHCKYCFNYLNKNNEDMEPDLAIAILEYIRLQQPKNKSRRILFYGGEPTLNRKSMFAMLDYIKNKNLAWTSILLTNGVIKDDVLSKLLNYQINYQVSFDGFEKNLRVSKNLKDDISHLISNTIQKLVNANQIVKIRATIHADNVMHMDEMVSFVHDTQAHCISFAPICHFGDAIKFGINRPEINDYVKNLHKAVQLANKLGVLVTIHESTYYRIYPFQKKSVPFVWLPDGSLAMTITYASSKIKEAKSIIIGQFEIEKKQLNLDVRKIAKMNKNFKQYYKKICQQCKLTHLCRGLNNISSYLTNTYIPERENYHCEISKEIFSLLGNELINH